MDIQLMGAAINGVIKAIINPEILLKDFPRYNEIIKLENCQYYPLSLYLDLVDFIEKKYTNKIVMIKLGISVGKSVIETAFPSNISSVKEAVEQIQKAHELFCRPVNGEFRIIEEREGFIRLRYTSPYNCILQEGLLIETAEKYGGRLPKVTHPECRRNGKEACIFEIKWFA